MGALLTTHVGEKGLGYIPDLRLKTDVPLRLVSSVAALPDVSPDFPLSPRTSDQGSLGSCTGQATCDSKEDIDRALGLGDAEWSRLWNYLGGRLALNNLTIADYAANPTYVHSVMVADTGARIRDVVQFMSSEGTISEALWPHLTDRYADLPEPWKRAQAKRHNLLGMKYLSSAEEIRVAIHEKHPVVLGFLVYDQFADVGLDGEYRVTSGRVRGGHAVRVVKHDKTKIVSGFRPGAALCRNSWGITWGCVHPTMAAQIPGRGFFWMPDEVIDSTDVDDIWAFTASE